MRAIPVAGLVGLAVLAFACSSNPTGPSREASPAPVAASGDEGGVSANATTIERIRLRRANGPDFVTSLVSGQVIEVPPNVNLDIWAEIAMAAAQRAGARN